MLRATKQTAEVRWDRESGRLAVAADSASENLGFFRALPGARWSKERKRWTCEATPLAAAMLAEKFAIDNGHGQASAVRDLEPLRLAHEAQQLGPTRFDPPNILGATPWLHQVAGWRFAAHKYAAILNADMGTGKSVMAIMLSIYWQTRLVLILCPKSVQSVWRRELSQFEPRGPTTVVLDQGSTARRAEELRIACQTANHFDRVTYVVINYEAAWRPAMAKILLAQPWSLVICDESHRIKSHAGRASKFAAEVGGRAERRLALTGTLLPHSPLDSFAQMRFLEPAEFGTSWIAFRARYARCNPMFPSKVEAWLNQEELAEKIGKYTFRVLAKDVLTLPPQIHTTIDVDLGKETQRVYRELESEMIAEVRGGMVTAANALTKLLRLAQVTSGYCPLDKEDGSDAPATLEVLGNEKQSALEDLLEDLPATEPVVVFATFRHDLASIAAAAQKLGRTYAEISGSRKDALDEHAKLHDWPQLIGVQWQSGGVGIDLTRAAYCVFYSHTFNRGNYDQAIARLHRPGQTRPVRYFRLQARGTVDEQIYKAIDASRDVVESVLDAMKKGKDNG